MLCAKFQGYRIYGSGEEDFQIVFTRYGHCGHLGHPTRTNYINFENGVLLMYTLEGVSSVANFITAYEESQ